MRWVTFLWPKANLGPPSVLGTRRPTGPRSRTLRTPGSAWFSAAPGWCAGADRFRGTTANLTVRTGSSTATAKDTPSVRNNGANLTITCKLENQVINGNKFWYKVRDGGWVSARYLSNKGKAPAWC